jgi:hypothetical protein
MVAIIDPDAVLEFLTITSPTSAQSDAMEVITKSVESDIKQTCRWCVTSQSFVYRMPQHGSSHGIPLRSTLGMMGRLPDRLQLPQMRITAVSEIREDVTLAFGDTTILTVDTDYQIEDLGGIGESGGILRINNYWPSVPLSIKISFTAGYTEADLDGPKNGLRFRAMKECIARWFTRQKELAMYVTGLGGDTSGLLVEEELGDYRAKWATAAAGKALMAEGLSPEFQDYLMTAGYVFRGIGV